MIGLALALIPATARAQAGISLSVVSDDRFRGRSMSDGKPVASLDLSADLPGGVYAGASASTILTSGDRAGLLGSQQYAGYATRVSPMLTLDLGIANTFYTRRYSGNRQDDFVEAYAGARRGAWSAYLRYSPSYFALGVPTLYGEVNGVRSLGVRWRLEGHAGVVTQVAGPTRLGGDRAHWDARIGVARLAGPVELRLTATAGGRDGRYYDGAWHGTTALTIGATRNF